MADPVSSQIEIEKASGVSGGALEPSRMWPWTRLLVWLISLYQRAGAGRPSPCRFTPSCSTYAAEALVAHGTIKGGTMAVWRILRCNPWGGQGFDPVPHSHSKGRPSPRYRRDNSRTDTNLNYLHNHQKAH